jgi:hypothetical protein
MKIGNETSVRALLVGFLVLVAFVQIPMGRVAAATGGLSLPSAIVTMEVRNGTQSYFNTTLSDVPSGYDVANGTYLGWCVDISAEMARSPATHQVRLYSSINPPGTLALQRWDMANYVLNHKNGTADDIQQAIWYFVHMDGNYTPHSTMAWAIVNDTLANGNGFVPGNGQTLAVISFPVVMFPTTSNVQISIIEVMNAVVPEFPASAISILFALTTLPIVIVCKRRQLRRAL